MNELLEDYKKKLVTIQEMINRLKFKDDSNPDYVRLNIKASCYRTFVSELERAKTVDLVAFSRWQKTTEFNVEGHSEYDCVTEYLRTQ